MVATAGRRRAAGAALVALSRAVMVSTNKPWQGHQVQPVLVWQACEPILTAHTSGSCLFCIFGADMLPLYPAEAIKVTCSEGFALNRHSTGHML
jgi:hypothetical protein